MVDLTTPPLPDLSTPATTDWFLTWRGTSPFRLTLGYMPVKNADGQWLFDKATVAVGASNMGARLTQNGGAGGGYTAGSATEAIHAHNMEFITGTGWVARQTTASMVRQNGANFEFYANTGLTIGSAFSPTLRYTINGTTGGMTLAGGGAAITGPSNVTGGFFGVGTASPFCQFHSAVSVAGGSPATSGTTDSNVGMRLQFGSVALDFGVRAAGPIWLQPRLVSNFASNFDLDLCPNGGAVTIGSATTASAANLFQSASGTAILRSTSSARYKRNVETVSPEYADNVLNLRPVWYQSTAEADNPDFGYWGFIAEEAAKVDPRLVHWAYLASDFELIEVAPEMAAVFDDKGEMVTEAQPASFERRVKNGAIKVPDGFQYERVAVLLLDVVKRLKVEVAELRAALNAAS